MHVTEKLRKGYFVRAVILYVSPASEPPKVKFKSMVSINIDDFNKFFLLREESEKRVITLGECALQPSQLLPSLQANSCLSPLSVVALGLRCVLRGGGKDRSWSSFFIFIIISVSLPSSPPPAQQYTANNHACSLARYSLR